MPVPHHVVSPPLNPICCPVKLILLQSNKWQSSCLSLTASLALPPFCKLYTAFCSPPCSLLREASATITAAMTKGRICNRTGPVLYRGLHSFHGLTAWLAAGTGGVDHEQRGRSGQRVAFCVLLTMGLLRGKAPLKRTENWGGDGERTVLIPTAIVSKWCNLQLWDTSTSSVGCWPLAGQNLDQSLWLGSERKNTEENEGQLGWLFKLLTSAILYLEQSVFPIQTMTNCVQYRPNKWIVFVYMEAEHSTVG